MDIFGFLGGVIKPVSDLVDNIHTSDEEKMKLRNQLVMTQNQFAEKLLDYETKLMESKSNIILAEAKGQSWLQRNWRPMMMLFFCFLLAMFWMGFTSESMTQETINNLFTVLKIGIGGYIAGRSAEKIIPKVSDIFKK